MEPRPAVLPSDGTDSGQAPKDNPGDVASDGAPEALEAAASDNPVNAATSPRDIWEYGWNAGS
jgi:hypothetical protein